MTDESAEQAADTVVVREKAPSIWNKALDLITHERAAARAAAAEDAKTIARLTHWAHTYGESLCPRAGCADSFGDGMRAAKHEVLALILARGSR